MRIWLHLRWSPQQIAAHLAKLHPHESALRVSHETIYNVIYAQPRGELKRELVACLRMARVKRWPRSRGEDRRGQMADLLSIHVRPPEVQDRQFPGDCEGDLIKGILNARAKVYAAARDANPNRWSTHGKLLRYAVVFAVNRRQDERTDDSWQHDAASVLP